MNHIVAPFSISLFPHSMNTSWSGSNSTITSLDTNNDSVLTITSGSSSYIMMAKDMPDIPESPTSTLRQISPLTHVIYMTDDDISMTTTDYEQFDILDAHHVVDLRTTMAKEYMLPNNIVTWFKNLPYTTDK